MWFAIVDLHAPEFEQFVPVLTQVGAQLELVRRLHEHLA